MTFSLRGAASSADVSRQNDVIADDNSTGEAARSTNEALFLHHPNHLLAPLLPNETHTPYHLSPRRHNRQLIPKTNKLYDSNFIQCMLYKDLYWLKISTLIYVLLLELYCIFYYYVSRVELRFDSL